MSNPKQALQNLCREVSNHVETAEALGGVTEKEATLGVILTLAIIHKNNPPLYEILMDAARSIEQE